MWRGPSPTVRYAMWAPSGRSTRCSPGTTGSRLARSRSAGACRSAVRGSASRPDERGRHLEPGEPVPAKSDERGVARVGGAGAEDDGRNGHVPELRVAAGDDAGVGDGRVVEEDSLDLRRRDVLAAADDPVGAPVGDGQPAVVVETPEVAGPQPAVSAGHAPRRGSSRYPSNRPAPDLDLADVRRVRVGDPELDPGQCAAGAPGMAAASSVGQGRDSGSGLGQAVRRHDRPARVERAPDEGGGGEGRAFRWIDAEPLERPLVQDDAEPTRAGQPRRASGRPR